MGRTCGCPWLSRDRPEACDGSTSTASTSKVGVAPDGTGASGVTRAHSRLEQGAGGVGGARDGRSEVHGAG
jgi:hypothetical protein